MNTETLASKTAFEIAELCRTGVIKSDEPLCDVSRNCSRRESRIHGYVEFDIAKVKKPADSDQLSGKLCGVPVALKDNICVEGWEATCCSRILKNYYAPYSATVVRKLLAEGAMICGRTNMDEFAFGSSCETSCYGPTRNPWDLERVPGGSSGGSASCVAADTAFAALGSDTGGSIRQPASLCGVVGLKPTYGRVSRYGLIAFASSLDQIGPLTKDVRDSALILSAIAGHDPKDSTSVNLPVPDYLAILGKKINGLRIGYPKEYFLRGLDPEVNASIQEAIKQYEKLGAVVEEISLPHTKYAVSVYYLVAPSEASSNLARFDGVRFGYRTKDAQNLLQMYEKTRGEGFGAEAKRRIILGTFSLSSGYYEAYYLRAMKVRTRIKNDFEAAFKRVDLVLTPTAPTTAFKIGEKADDPIQMYLSDIFTISANLAGVPAISIPCGFSRANLPIGLQLIAKPFDEETLFKAAYAFEQSTDYHLKKPCLTDRE